MSACLLYYWKWAGARHGCEPHSCEQVAAGIMALAAGKTCRPRHGQELDTRVERNMALGHLLHKMTTRQAEQLQKCFMVL